MRGRNRPYHLKYLWFTMVGAEGFEPPTLCSQSRCATRLRYAPIVSFDCTPNCFHFGSARASLHWCSSHAITHTTSTTGNANTSASTAPNSPRKHQSRQVWRRGSPRCRVSSR
jgi:hypothetical protein